LLEPIGFLLKEWENALIEERGTVS
jgi:hypothetical protein